MEMEGRDICNVNTDDLQGKTEVYVLCSFFGNFG